MLGCGLLVFVSVIFVTDFDKKKSRFFSNFITRLRNFMKMLAQSLFKNTDGLGVGRSAISYRVPLKDFEGTRAGVLQQRAGASSVDSFGAQDHPTALEFHPMAAAAVNVLSDLESASDRDDHSSSCYGGSSFALRGVDTASTTSGSAEASAGSSSN